MTEYHSFEDAQCVNKDSLTVKGSFAPAGTGAVTGVQGRGFTVARTAPGLYLVTLNFPIAGFIDGSARLRMATAEAGFHVVELGTVDITTDPAAATFVIRHRFTAATDTTHPVNADVAAAAANVFSFELTVALSDIQGSGIV